METLILIGTSTLVSFQGKLVDSNNVPVETASFRITIEDEGDNIIWGPHIFNNTVSKGIYNLLLGETNEFYLVPCSFSSKTTPPFCFAKRRNSKYKILLEVNIGNETFGTPDVTYGDNSPGEDVIWFMG